MCVSRIRTAFFLASAMLLHGAAANQVFYNACTAMTLHGAFAKRDVSQKIMETEETSLGGNDSEDEKHADGEHSEEQSHDEEKGHGDEMAHDDEEMAHDEAEGNAEGNMYSSDDIESPIIDYADDLNAAYDDDLNRASTEVGLELGEEGESHDGVVSLEGEEQESEEDKEEPGATLTNTAFAYAQSGRVDAQLIDNIKPANTAASFAQTAQAEVVAKDVKAEVASMEEAQRYSQEMETSKGHLAGRCCDCPNGMKMFSGGWCEWVCGPAKKKIHYTIVNAKTDCTPDENQKITVTNNWVNNCDAHKCEIKAALYDAAVWKTIVTAGLNQAIPLTCVTVDGGDKCVKRIYSGKTVTFEINVAIKQATLRIFRPDILDEILYETKVGPGAHYTFTPAHEPITIRNKFDKKIKVVFYPAQRGLQVLRAGTALGGTNGAIILEAGERTTKFIPEGKEAAWVKVFDPGAGGKFTEALAMVLLREYPVVKAGSTLVISDFTLTHTVSASCQSLSSKCPNIYVKNEWCKTIKAALYARHDNLGEFADLQAIAMLGIPLGGIGGRGVKTIERGGLATLTLPDGYKQATMVIFEPATFDKRLRISDYTEFIVEGGEFHTFKSGWDLENSGYCQAQWLTDEGLGIPGKCCACKDGLKRFITSGSLLTCKTKCSPEGSKSFQKVVSKANCKGSSREDKANMIRVHNSANQTIKAIIYDSASCGRVNALSTVKTVLTAGISEAIPLGGIGGPGVTIIQPGEEGELYMHEKRMECVRLKIFRPGVFDELIGEYPQVKANKSAAIDFAELAPIKVKNNFGKRVKVVLYPTNRALQIARMGLPLGSFWGSGVYTFEPNEGVVEWTIPEMKDEAWVKVFDPGDSGFTEALAMVLLREYPVVKAGTYLEISDYVLEKEVGGSGEKGSSSNRTIVVHNHWCKKIKAVLYPRQGDHAGNQSATSKNLENIGTKLQAVAMFGIPLGGVNGPGVKTIEAGKHGTLTLPAEWNVAYETTEKTKGTKDHYEKATMVIFDPEDTTSSNLAAFDKRLKETTAEKGSTWSFQSGWDKENKPNCQAQWLTGSATSLATVTSDIETNERVQVPMGQAMATDQDGQDQVTKETDDEDDNGGVQVPMATDTDAQKRLSDSESDF